MTILNFMHVLVPIACVFAEKGAHATFAVHHGPTIYDFSNFEKTFCQHGEHGNRKKTGNYAHPKYCEKFITCEHFEHHSGNAKATVQFCPYGLFYNPKNDVCDWPINVDCFLYQGKTCLDGRGNKFGRFKATQTGYIRGIKMIHEDGYINCKYYQPTYKSFWGCNTEVAEFKYLVNTWITTDNDIERVIFPTHGTPRDPYGNYELKDYNQLSPYIKWYSDPQHTPTKVHQGQQLRVWYMEDLFDIHQQDNRERH